MRKSVIGAVAGALVVAVSDEIGAPVRAMFPGGTVIPGNHDFARHVRRVQINVRDQSFTRVDCEP